MYIRFTLYIAAPFMSFFSDADGVAFCFLTQKFLYGNTIFSVIHHQYLLTYSLV